MDKNTLCYVNIRLFGYFVMALPASATIITVCWSLLYDFEGSTATHCRVRNILPTISAAISRQPQCYIWRIFIALHAAPRFMYAAAYYNWFQQVHVGKQQTVYEKLVKLCSVLSIIENLMLVTLTCISSLENKDLHENSFVAFVVSSWLYMLLTIFLVRWGIEHRPNRAQPTDYKALRLKKIYAACNIGSFVLALYFYFRHNRYCEPYVYSMFALCEYITIFTNILYHGCGPLLVRDYSPAIVLTDLITKYR